MTGAAASPPTAQVPSGTSSQVSRVGSGSSRSARAPSRSEADTGKSARSTIWQAVVVAPSRMTPRPGAPPVTTPRGRPARAACVPVAAPRTSLRPMDPAHRAVEATKGAVSSRGVPAADVVRITASSRALPWPGPSTSSMVATSASTLSRHRRSVPRCPLAASPHSRARRRGSSVPTTVPTPGWVRSSRMGEASSGAWPEAPKVGEAKPHRCTPRPAHSAAVAAEAMTVDRPDLEAPRTSSGRVTRQCHSPRLCWRGRSVTARRRWSSSHPDSPAWSAGSVGASAPSAPCSSRSPGARGPRSRTSSSASAALIEAGRAGAQGRHGEACPWAAREMRSTILWTSRVEPHQGA